MSTSKSVVDHLLHQLSPLHVRARAMFGEYALYCDDKVVALLCDDRVYLKLTEASEGLEPALEHGAPFPGAKDHGILDERYLEDARTLRGLVQATADRLHLPKPKKKKATRRRAES